MKHTLYITNEQTRINALRFIRGLVIAIPYELTIKEVFSVRNLEQNAKMWAVLGDISKQVEWHGMYLSKEEWKEMITAALKKQKVVPGIDGGFVVIGASTSKMSIREMTDVIDFAYAFGSDPEHDVKWSEVTKSMREWE